MSFAIASARAMEKGGMTRYGTEENGDPGETNYYWLRLPPYPGDIVIDTDGRSVQDIVEEMKRHIAALYP